MPALSLLDRRRVGRARRIGIGLEIAVALIRLPRIDKSVTLPLANRLARNRVQHLPGHHRANPMRRREGFVLVP